MSILTCLDRPIAFQRVFVTITNSIPGALMLSQACYWQKRCNSEDGWWWKTYDEWTEETGMSRYNLNTARKACSKFLESKARGIPAKNYYRVLLGPLAIAIEELDSDQQPSTLESSKLESWKAANRLAGKQQTTNEETSSEISSETKKKVHQFSDESKKLVDLFRESFDHYPEKLDPAATTKELQAAECLLQNISAEEVIRLAESALEDDFPGYHKWGSSLHMVNFHLCELSAMYREFRADVAEIERTWDRTIVDTNV